MKTMMWHNSISGGLRFPQITALLLSLLILGCETLGKFSAPAAPPLTANVEVRYALRPLTPKEQSHSVESQLPNSALIIIAAQRYLSDYAASSGRFVVAAPTDRANYVLRGTIIELRVIDDYPTLGDVASEALSIPASAGESTSQGGVSVNGQDAATVQITRGQRASESKSYGLWCKLTLELVKTENGVDKVVSRADGVRA